MRDDRVQHDWVLDWEAPPVANTRVGLYNEARLKGAYDELEEKPVVYSTPAELATQYQGKYEKLRATPRADVPRFWRQHVADGRRAERQPGSGRTWLMNLIDEGDLLKAAELAKLCGAEYMTVNAASADGGAPRGALHALAAYSPAATEWGGSPAAAVEEQRVSLLRIMLAHGASPARAKCGPLSPLYVACANAHVDDDFLDALREAGAPLMCAAFAQADGAQLDGRTLAMGAAYGGSVRALRWLLRRRHVASSARESFCGRAAFAELSPRRLCAYEVALEARRRHPPPPAQTPSLHRGFSQPAPCASRVGVRADRTLAQPPCRMRRTARAHTAGAAPRPRRGHTRPPTQRATLRRARRHHG